MPTPENASNTYKSQISNITGGFTNVSYYGAVGDATIGGSGTDDQSAIQSAISDTNTVGRGIAFSGKTYNIGSSLELYKEKHIRGTGKSFSGTVLQPTGNFSAIVDSTSVSSIKNKVSGMMILGTNVTSNYVIVLDACFLSEFEDIWIRNSQYGISILNSNSLHFRNVLVMEDNDVESVRIGVNSQNINFTDCNFEATTVNTGGHVIINAGNGVNLSTFTGCQIERANLDVIAGTVKWYGGKISVSSKVLLRQRSTNCYIDSACFDAVYIQDFGYNTVVNGVNCYNMSTPEHRWPTPTPTSTGTSPTYGLAGEEWLFLVTAEEKSNASVSGGYIELKDGSTVLDTSPTFDFDASSGTIGSVIKPNYTFCAGVKTTSNPISVVVTTAELKAVRGGKNLLTDGTELDTTWSTTNCAVTGSTGSFTLTPSTTNWNISQSITSICKVGKKYIAVAKFSGTAVLCGGNAASGTAGNRPLFSTGIADLYGDGDTVAMISFEYNGTFSDISLGYVGSDSAVTGVWIMLIEA